MSRSLLGTGIAAVGLALLVGCAPTYGHHHHVGYHHHHRGSGAGFAAVVGTILLVDAIAHIAAEPPPPRTAVYVYSAPPPPPVIVAAAPPAPSPPRADDLPPLDPAATRAAFAEADLSGCNAPPVYGHAKISLNPDGHVSRVVIEDPPDLDPAVAQCIGKRIGHIRVAPFRGGMVVLGTTFRAQEP